MFCFVLKVEELLCSVYRHVGVVFFLYTGIDRFIVVNKLQEILITKLIKKIGFTKLMFSDIHLIITTCIMKAFNKSFYFLGIF